MPVLKGDVEAGQRDADCAVVPSATRIPDGERPRTAGTARGRRVVAPAAGER